mgnify:FL=1
MIRIGLAAAAPSYHPAPELLLDHAAGGRSEAEALLIDLHLTMCPACRAAACVCDSVGGALLEAIEPTWLPPNLLNRTLAAIDTDAEAPPARSDGHDAVRIDAAAGPWRRFPGGVALRRLSAGHGDERLLLMRIPAGGRVVRHRHVRPEWSLVLRGGYADAMGRYRAGDFVLREAADEHRPVADGGEGCVCLTLVRGPLVYPGLAGLAFRTLARLKGGI